MATVATIADTTIVGDNEDQLVTMVVDNQLFGIPILQVQDIVEASKITPVPLAPSAIAGVLNLRGRIVTVVDLRKLMGNHEEVPWESQMGVTVDYKGDLYTLLVDAIGDVRTLPKNDFDKAPSTMEDNVRRLCSGIYRLRGNLLVVLDVARILQTEIIEATPMLTVEERRTRKEAAITGSDGGDARAHQLSALMTDLNAYESETEGVFGATSDAAEDDIKSRKRASRDRRPIAERWREVLEEKARKAGHVAYRMREPDEETVETARTEMAQEDEEWAARVIDEAGTPPPAEDREGAPDIPIHEAPDLPPPAAEDFGESPVPAMESTEPESVPDSPAAPPDAQDDPSLMLDTAPDLPVADAPTDPESPAAPDIMPDTPIEQLDTGLANPRPEDPGPEDFPGIDPAADVAASEPEATAADPAAPANDAEDPQSPQRDFGGITSGWWNKLRGKAGGGESVPKPPGPSEDQQADTAEPDSAEPDEVEPQAGSGESVPQPPGPSEDQQADTAEPDSAEPDEVEPDKIEPQADSMPQENETPAEAKAARKKTAAKKKPAAKKKAAAKPAKSSKTNGKSTAKAKPKKKK